jgi:hypothetical protein
MSASMPPARCTRSWSTHKRDRAMAKRNSQHRADCFRAQSSDAAPPLSIRGRRSQGTSPWREAGQEARTFRHRARRKVFLRLSLYRCDKTIPPASSLSTIIAAGERSEKGTFDASYALWVVIALREVIDEPSRDLKVRRFESFREAAVHESERLAGLIALPAFGEQAGQGHR